MLAAQMVGLEDDQNPVFKSSLLPMCVSLFSVSRNCTLKIEYLSGETVKDVEKIKGRFVGVLPNSCILGYSCLSVFYFTTLKIVANWQPTPVFLPGETQGWGSLVGCRLWGRTEPDTTEVT